MAAEQGLNVDEDGFRRLMSEQRERAKRDAAEKKTGNADITAFAELLERSGAVTFTGYDQISGEATVLGLLVNGVPVPVGGRGHRGRPGPGPHPVLRRGRRPARRRGHDPGDRRRVRGRDVQTPLPGLIVHRGQVRSGEITVGAPAFAEIDVERRRALSRSHTATHLVHRALRSALGESAAQAGSENSPGRLRFDFTAQAAVPVSVLRDTEDEVNDVLVNDLDVHAFYTSQEEARQLGALALFGEKYGDQVRVVEVGDYSRELCGGTHVARSGQLGLIKVLGESSIGSACAGSRRWWASTRSASWPGRARWSASSASSSRRRASSCRSESRPW
jgi:alanyl-tRNA synthetase